MAPLTTGNGLPDVVVTGVAMTTAVATDAHQLGDLQQAQQGLAWIDKKLGHATTVRLFDHAPRALLAGDLPD